jgi:hypothetical protein
VVEQGKEQLGVTIDGGAGCRVGVAGRLMEQEQEGSPSTYRAERSRSLVSFSFPYSTGVTEETDVDIVIKNECAHCTKVEIYWVDMQAHERVRNVAKILGKIQEKQTQYWYCHLHKQLIGICYCCCLSSKATSKLPRSGHRNQATERSTTDVSCPCCLTACRLRLPSSLEVRRTTNLDIGGERPGVLRLKRVLLKEYLLASPTCTSQD